MTNAEYHARPEISKSDLDLLAKSPFHFKNKDFFRYESKAFDIGSAVHTIVLEPEAFEKEYAVAPEADRRTKAGKELYEKFVQDSNGKTVLSQEDFEIATEMAQSINQIKASSLFLSRGKAEQSFFSELNGVPVRCRPDYYNAELGIVVDLKTTQDASAYGFQSSVARFNYHIQASFYTDVMRSLGLEVNKFLFIAVEKKAPYMVGFYELDDVAIEEGRKKYEELLELYKHCKETDHWWGYARYDKITNKVDVVQTLTLPTWKFYE